jgi:hypothetical protein
MSSASSSNGSASVTQQPTAHNNYDNLTESEFLTHQAELARTAISGALAELKTELSKAGNVKLWTHHYPWVSLGVAAATGFTLAAVVKKGTADVTPQDEEDVERHRLLHQFAETPYNSRPGEKPQLGQSLMGSLFSLARTALEASLVSAIRADGIARGHTGSTPPEQVTPPAACTPAAPLESMSAPVS